MKRGYDPERAGSLVVVPISKIAAEQRAGRAGRTEAGQCYRLYSKACFDAMAPETIPEIRRSSMASVALALKSLRIVDVLGFDFLDAPDQKQLACALLELHALGALESHGILTPLGHAMAWNRTSQSCFGKRPLHGRGRDGPYGAKRRFGSGSDALG